MTLVIECNIRLTQCNVMLNCMCIQLKPCASLKFNPESVKILLMTVNKCLKCKYEYSMTADILLHLLVSNAEPEE